MNAIQQISLKLQLGLDPATDIQPVALRALWRARTLRRPDAGAHGPAPAARAALNASPARSQRPA